MSDADRVRSGYHEFLEWVASEAERSEAKVTLARVHTARVSTPGAECWVRDTYALENEIAFMEVLRPLDLDDYVCDEWEPPFPDSLVLALRRFFPLVSRMKLVDFESHVTRAENLLAPCLPVELLRYQHRTRTIYSLEREFVEWFETLRCDGCDWSVSSLREFESSWLFESQLKQMIRVEYSGLDLFLCARCRGDFLLRKAFRRKVLKWRKERQAEVDEARRELVRVKKFLAHRARSRSPGKESTPPGNSPRS